MINSLFSRKGILVVLLAVIGMAEASAQYNTNPTQSVCMGQTDYYVVPDNPSNTFLWTIAPGSAGVDWTIVTPNAVNTEIIWLKEGNYTLTFRETSATACFQEVTLAVTVNPAAILVITDPAPVCEPGTVDLTVASITAGSTLPTGTILTYWTDDAGTVPLSNPNAVTLSGTYYIRAESAAGCTDIKPVNVTINPKPVTSLIWHK